MSVSRRFRVGLYEEHLAELSFLYDQRRAYLHDPELTWVDLTDLDERIEAHLDALVLGEDLALDVCKKHCASEDSGELHASMRVFCRQDRPELAYAILQNLKDGDDETIQAVVDALKLECPESWYDDLLRVISGRCTHVIPVLAESLAFRRVPAEQTVLRVAPSCPPQRKQSIAWSLGRVGTDQSLSCLREFLSSEEEELAAAACRALIRLGDYQAVRHGLLVAQMKPWPIMALGIGGNHAAVNVLTDICKGDRVSGEALLALGLLGDLKSVATLFDCLANPEHALAAAVALQTITGAVLYNEVFVPDEIDPDELFDEELDRYEQTGAVPTRSDGQPFGQNVTQISVNPETWRAWLTEHKSRFDPRLRYRNGKPYGPVAVVESLAAEHSPNRVRDLICDELVVRFRAPVQLEIDQPVRHQQLVLAELTEWARDAQGRFEPGRWYFAGKPMD